MAEIGKLPSLGMYTNLFNNKLQTNVDGTVQIPTFDSTNTIGSAQSAQQVANPITDNIKGLGSQVPAYLTSQGQSLGFNPTNSDSSGANDSGWFGLDANGVSKFSNVMTGIGAGIQGATSLGGLWLANENLKATKDQQNYLKDREAKNDARLSQFAKNAGGIY